MTRPLYCRIRRKKISYLHGVEDSLDDDDEAARRQLSNPGVVMRKPWKCKAGVNPCGGVSSRAGWGRNAWWKDIRSSGEGRAFTDDGSPVPQVRTGALDGKWDGWITPAARRRLAEIEQPPFADFRTTDLFEEEVVNAAQVSASIGLLGIGMLQSNDCRWLPPRELTSRTHTPRSPLG